MNSHTIFILYIWFTDYNNIRKIHFFKKYSLKITNISINILFPIDLRIMRASYISNISEIFMVDVKLRYD